MPNQLPRIQTVANEIKDILVELGCFRAVSTCAASSFNHVMQLSGQMVVGAKAIVVFGGGVYDPSTTSRTDDMSVLIMTPLGTDIISLIQAIEDRLVPLEDEDGEPQYELTPTGTVVTLSQIEPVSSDNKTLMYVVTLKTFSTLQSINP